MRKTRWLTAALAVLVGIAAPLRAAEGDSKKTLLTVSFAGYDALKKSIDFLAKTGGRSELPEQADMAIQAATGGMISAMDAKEPWGLVVKTNDNGLKFFVEGFLPTKNLKPVLQLIPTPVPPEEKDGLFEIQAGPQKLYAKQAGSWAYIADNLESLKDLGDSPVKSLNGLNKKYLLAIDANLKNIPESLRTRAISAARGMMIMQAMKNPGAGEEQRKSMEQSIKQIEKLLEQGEYLRLGIGIDEKDSKAFLEFLVKMKPDSKLAAQFAKNREMKTDFAGFNVPENAVNLRVGSLLGEDEKENAKIQIASLSKTIQKEIRKEKMSPEQGEKASKFVEKWIAVLEKSLDSGKVDTAATVAVDNTSQLTILAAAGCDGAKLGPLFRETLTEFTKEDKDLEKSLKFDADKHDGVAFHTFTIPVKDGSKDEMQVLGNPISVVIGIGDKAVYMGMGKDSLPGLKAAMDRSKSAGATSPEEQFSLAVSMKGLMPLLAATCPQHTRAHAEKVAKTAKTLEGKDHLRIYSKVSPKGIQTNRVELEENFIKIVFALATDGEGEDAGDKKKEKESE